MGTGEIILRQIDSIEKATEHLTFIMKNTNDPEILISYSEVIRSNALIISDIVEKYKEEISTAETQVTIQSPTPDCKDTPSSELSGVFTVSEVSRILNVSTRSVYDLVNQKKLKCVRIGKAIKIPKIYLEEFIKNSPI